MASENLRPQFFHSPETLDVDDISIGEDSGWRDLDLQESEKIERRLREGHYGQTQLPLPSVVTVGRRRQFAADGLALLNNGKKIVYVLQKLKKEHRERNTARPTASGRDTARGDAASGGDTDTLNAFSAPLVAALENGIPVVEADYLRHDPELIAAFNAESHEADNNCFQATTVPDLVRVGSIAHTRVASGSWSDTRDRLLDIYGPKRRKYAWRCAEAALRDAKAAVQEDGLCQCSGNCGWVVCVNNHNAQRGARERRPLRICGRKAWPGNKWCGWCKCEVAGCQSPRNKSYSKRWCKSCVPKRAAQDHQYANAFGVWPIAAVGKQNPVRFVARTAFLLDRVLPDDTRAWLEFVSASNPFEGQAIQPQYMVLVFLAQAFKWPPVVRHMTQLVSTMRVSEIDAAALSRLCKDLLRWADGRSWPTLMTRMNFGLMFAQTGLQPAAGKLGLIQPATPSTGTRSRRTSSRGNKREFETIELGHLQTVYRIVDDDAPLLEIMNHCLETATAHAWVWPRSPDEVVPFFEAVTRFAKSCRTFTTANGHGLTGGRTNKHAYHVKSFTRLMILACCSLPESERDGLVAEKHKFPSSSEFDNAMVWSAIGKWPISRLVEYTPDENEWIEKPISDMSCLEIRRRFDVCPVLLSGWFCLAAVPKTHILEAALKADESSYWTLVRDYYNSERSLEDSFPPGPHIIAAEAAAAASQTK